MQSKKGHFPILLRGPLGVCPKPDNILKGGELWSRKKLREKIEEANCRLKILMSSIVEYL